MLVHPMRFATTRSRKRWFLSHHHSDATVDYPNLLILSWRNGYNGPKKPIRVLGPENHGALHLIFRDRDVQPEVLVLRIPDARYRRLDPQAARGVCHRHQ